MSDLGNSITLAPVDPIPTIIGSTRPSTTQSGLDTNIPSLTSIPFITPSSTLLSTTLVSPLPLTSTTQAAIPYPSISAISLSSISAGYPTVISTSTTVSDQTITSSVVETGGLSTDTPQDTGFARQTGVIIGVTIAGTFVFLLLIFLLFLACKRYHSNRSYNSSMEDISAISRDDYWRPPLEDQEYSYGRSMSPNYPQTPGRPEGGFFDNHLSVGRSGSAESADAFLNGAALRGQPRIPPVSYIPHGSRSYSSYDGLYTSWPWWGNTQPLNINKRNKYYRAQRPPPTVDSHMSAAEGTSSTGLGGGSSWHHGPGSSEALLTRGNTKTSITGPKPIHLLSGRRHYSTPPTAFMLGRDASLEYSARRIQQHQEEKEQQDRADKGISQAILARLHASRNLSTATTVKAYSQCTTLRSEESSSSHAPSHIYSPSLLNPPIRTPQTAPRLQLPGGVDNTLKEYPHYREGVGDTSEGFLWPGVTLPPAPSPAPTDTSSMVEGLLHPRLRAVLSQPHRSSVTSLRDHEDYTRPINGLVNNHIRSTTTFDMQDVGDFSEARA